MFLVQILLVLFTIRPAHATVCDAAFAIKPSGIEVSDQALGKMADLLGLDAPERTNINSYGKFVAEVLDARANGRPIATLHSHHFAVQSQKLLEFIAAYLQAWRKRYQNIFEALGGPVTRLKSEIENLEKDLRAAKSTEVIERRRNDVRDTLNRQSMRSFGSPADLESLSHLIDTVSANPDKLLFELKQQLPKLELEVAQKRKQAQDNSFRAFNALLAVKELLEKRGDDIDYQTFLQLEIALAAIDEYERQGFVPKEEVSDDRGLESTYGIKFDDVEKNLVAWHTGRTKSLGGEISNLVKERLQHVKRSGMVILPIIGTFSHRESLALAFLPIYPVRFQDQTTWVSNFETTPQRGSPVTDFDLSAIPTDTGYSFQALHKHSPQAWIDAINRAFNNWYLMLGGHLGPAPLERKDLRQEALVQALLYTARYLTIHEESIDWTHSTDLVRYFFRGFLEWDKEELLNPNMMHFMAAKAPDFFAALGIQEAIGENDLVSTVDKLLARLMRNPEVNLKDDPKLKALLERFPTTVYSAKIFVMRALKPPADERRLPRDFLSPM